MSKNDYGYATDTANWEQANMGNFSLNEGYVYLFIVRAVDKMVLNDEDAYHEFYVRAKSPQEAEIRAILRHGITEETLDDYDIHVEHKFIVSKVDEDAE